MTAVRRHATLLLLAIRGAASSDPDERAELGRVVAIVDSMDHDVLPFTDLDAAARFLVAHELVEVEDGEVFSLTSLGYAATAGTSQPTTVDAVVALVGRRLESLSVDAGRDGPEVVWRAAYDEAVGAHLGVPRPPPHRPTSPGSPSPAPSPAPGAAAEPVAAAAVAGGTATVDASRAPTSVTTALKLAGIVAAGTALVVVGLPSAAVVIGTAGIGSAVAIADLSARRVAGAHARVPAHELAAYPVQVPAERVAVGGRFQFRLLPPTSSVWARGLLCVRDDHVRFVSADERRAGRDWEGPCDRLEVQYLGAGDRVASIVRVHHPEGQPQAQFVVQGRFRP